MSPHRFLPTISTSTPLLHFNFVIVRRARKVHARLRASNKYRKDQPGQPPPVYTSMLYGPHFYAILRPLSGAKANHRAILFVCASRIYWRFTPARVYVFSSAFCCVLRQEANAAVPPLPPHLLLVSWYFYGFRVIPANYFSALAFLAALVVWVEQSFFLHYGKVKPAS